MSEIEIRPDLGGAAQAIAQARDDVYSDPASVVVRVQRLESLLGELDGHPETQEVWDALMQTIELVETAGTGDVDFDELSAALDEVEAAYSDIVSIIRDAE